nr:glycosyltransferase [Actinomycetota bacterium]
ATPYATAGAGPLHTEPRTVTVSVIIVNMDGAEHLRTCLDSVATQDYPRQLLDVIVVDNGSSDDSLDLIASYPEVRALPQPKNLGFAPAVNLAVGVSKADCVVLLNNDTRVEPDFITRLVEGYDPENGVVCVGSKILSWDGTHLDFGEGAMNFYGMGMQVGFGLPIDAVSVVDKRELLFACGGAMLVDRRVYVSIDGFDESFFAYFEDVDFGWRLRLLGYRTRLAAGACCYHRMQGTSSRFPYHQRVLLYERNALRSIIKNYSADNLPRVLGAALLLLNQRAARRGGLDRAAYDFGSTSEPADRDARVAFAHVHAVADVVNDLEGLLAKRASVQRARTVSDDDITRLFQFPLDPVDPHDAHLFASQRAIVDMFGLDQWLGRHERAHHVLVVTTERVAEKMRGPAIRAVELAKALAGDASVTLATGEPVDVPLDTIGLDAVALHVASFSDERELLDLARRADVVVVQGYTLQRYPTLAGINGLLVADLYDPWLLENLELHRESGAVGAIALRQDASVTNDLLDSADFFICASERQRDYWLGLLTARGRIEPASYALDPTLRRMIDVVPFGVPEVPPRHDRPVLKGVHPAIAPDDLVLLWGGGAWDWFDPVSVIEAMPTVVAQIPNAKLYFLGLQLVDGNVADMRTAAQAVQRARDLGLEGKSVIFGDWVGYEERQAYLLEADVAVSAARDLVETRLAFRSRLLDAFWAGLPVVTTDGDALAEVVREERVGLVVPPGDVAHLAHAMVRLLGSAVMRAECSARALDVAQRSTWRQAVGPLRDLVRRPWGAVETRRLRPHGRLAVDAVSLLRMYRDDHAVLEAAERAERAELETLRHELEHLRAVVAHQDERLALVRNNPVYRFYLTAKRSRQERQ